MISPDPLRTHNVIITGTSNSTTRVPARIALGFLTAISILISILEIRVSRSMRPIADDYTIGVTAENGLIDSLMTWWQDWSGDITAQFFNTLLVGIPLQTLPWSFASAVPFLASSFLVAAAATWMVTSGNAATNSPGWKSTVLVLYPIFLVMWWGFWWLGTLTTDVDQNLNPYPRGIAFWQNLNAQYVFTPVALIWLWLWLLMKGSRAPRSSIGLAAIYLVLGVASGMALPAFAASSGILILMVLLGSWLMGNLPSKAQTGRWLAAWSGILIGGVLSHYSPGSQIRATVLPSPAIDNNLISRLIFLIPEGVVDFWGCLTDVGSFALAAVIGGVAYILCYLKVRFNAKRLFLYSIGLLAFALIMAVVSQLAVPFSYDAWWHLTSIKTIIWFGVGTFSVSLATYIHTRRSQPIFLTVAVFMAFAGLILAGASVVKMNSEVLLRLEAWNKGPAPISGAISDIEESWVRTSWLELNANRITKDLRPESDRGQTKIE